jgi:hypothetical protein
MLIRIPPGAVPSAQGVLQTGPVDGRCDRPSSTPDGLRQTVAGQNVERIALVAVSRTGRDRFPRLQGAGGSLQLQVAPGAKAGHFQIASSAEIRVAAKTEVVREQVEHLADDLAWLEAWAVVHP